MSLSKYKIPTEEVSVANGQTLVVHGLGIDAIVALVRGQGDVMRELYEKSQAGNLTLETSEALVETLLDESPVLVGLIIAFGCDEPDEWERGMKMPFADQVALLDAIIRLTLLSEGGAKKIAGIIARTAKSMVSLTGLSG